MIRLSVIVPAYNEEERIGKTLHTVQAYLDGQGVPYEIIVVDDGSSDGTAAIVEGMSSFGDKIRILRNETNSGKGYSVRRGMLEGRGEFLLFSDADLSTPIEEIEKLMPWFEQGYDIVVGSRALPASNVVVHQPFYRETMGRVFNLIVRACTVKGIKDTQCGFKCFRREAAHEVFGRQRTDGFSFDVEVLFIAQRLGYKVKEVPVDWYNSPDTKVNALSDSIKMFLDIIRIRLRGID